LRIDRKPAVRSARLSRTALRLGFAITLAMQILIGAPAFAGCTGDCDRNGRVAVNELIAGVNVALGRLSMESCEAIDRDGDGHADIDDLVHAVGDAVNDCNVPLTETPTTARMST